MSTEIVEIDYEHEALDEKALRSVTSAEIMLQHQIARQLPRKPSEVRRQALELVTENEDVAEECVYAVKRGTKVIEGASIRFAEIFGACWGNNRVLARVIDAGDYFVTAQGIFQDLETNRVVVKEEQRRIVDKDGKRYNIDMIGVTANAAASIALRNATLRGIAKPHWLPSYLAARSLIVGDARSMPVKRQKTIAVLEKMGATPDEVLRLLGINSEADIDGDMLLRLRGIINSVREDQTSIDFVFRDIRGSKPKTDIGAKIRNGRANHKGGDDDNSRQEERREAQPSDDTAEASRNKAKPAPNQGRAPLTDAEIDQSQARIAAIIGDPNFGAADDLGERSENEALFLDEFAKQVTEAGTREEVLAVVEEYDGAIKSFGKAVGSKVDKMVEERLSHLTKPSVKNNPKRSAAAAKL